MNNIKSNDSIISMNIESMIKTAIIFLIVYTCFLIFKPFLLPVVWAIIIAVAFYPLHLKFFSLLNNSRKLSAAIITLLILAILIVPTIFFIDALIESLKNLAHQFKEDTFQIPPPPDSVVDWPVIGKSVEKTWLFFSDNLSAAIETYQPQIRSIGEWLLTTISGFVTDMVMFIIAIIISGVFLVNSAGAYKLTRNIATKLAGDKGDEMVDNSKNTIKSVVYGVLGTALIQTAIISIGFFVAGVPGAAILSLIVLILAIVQIPLILVVLPVVIYMFTIMSGFSATLFTIWCIIGALSDNFLKPLLLGRGMKIPMLVILIGSIGGMMLTGITGLFMGAVVLALGYQIFQNWIGTYQMEEEKTG